jgi:hypothetical protein
VGTMSKGMALTLGYERSGGWPPSRHESCLTKFSPPARQREHWVRTGKTFSSEGQILGILAPAGTVSVVKPGEQNDPALIGVLKTFAGRMNTNYTMVDQHPFSILTSRRAS